MNVILWLQQPNFQLLNYALGNLARMYGALNFLGIYSPPAIQSGNFKNIAINGKPIPVVDKHALASPACDLIIVSGANLPAVINEAIALGIDAEKIVFDRTTAIYGFSLEKYRKLQRSQLSIISRGEFGSIVQQTFGLHAPSIGISASDRDFLNFLRNPQQNIGRELRNRINWYNLLVVMHTEDPKVLEEFDRLPFGKKVCFVPFETTIDSGYYIKPYYIGGRSLEHAINTNIFNINSCFDFWNMFLYGMKTPINTHSKSLAPIIHEGACKCATSDGRIKYFNWEQIDYSDGKFRYFDKGVMNNGDNIWFTKFIRSNVSAEKSFNFFSVQGDHRFVRQVRLERKIFYTNENVFHWPWYDGYQDYCLSAVQLAMGCEYLKAVNYLRFPWWLIVSFAPKLDMKLIVDRITEINSARNTRKYECVLIATHDMMNIRAPVCNKLQSVMSIKYAGKWNNNTDDLKLNYGDNKLRYTHDFMFNICSENCNRFGYVTEKLFQSFIAGSIPIYYGSDNRPEPGIINPDAVLFFDPKSDNEALVKEVVRLKNDEQYYDKFMRQEKLFAKPAAEYIYSTFEELAKRLREMQ